MDKVARFLHSHGIRLNTDLGQHFLIDEGVLQSIVEATHIQPDDHIVEIGPGIGILTAELLKKDAKVTAIELDARLISLLKEYVSQEAYSPIRANKRISFQKLDIMQGNALETPFPKTPYKIVANIPYHITSPLLRHAFLESEVHPSTMTLLLQREVAEKICAMEDHPRTSAKRGAGHSGLLTILVGLFGKPTLVRTVPPEAFLPPPKVDSAILHIDCFPEPLADTETIEEVFRLTKIGFSQKRKMLRNTLGSLEGGMERLARVGIDPKRRPQTLMIEEWIRLGTVNINMVG